jgi:hypothetical protein
MTNFSITDALVEIRTQNHSLNNARNVALKVLRRYKGFVTRSFTGCALI